MEHLTWLQLEDWMRESAILYDQDRRQCCFEGDQEFLFRIPVGDYRLQLDYRIKSALSLFPESVNLLLFRRGLRWELDDALTYPLDAVLAAIGIDPTSVAIRLAAQERMIAFAMMYMTNRWAHAGQSIYVATENKSDVMIYMPASTESIFVMARTKDVHDAAVKTFGKKNVPAYGPHIPQPINEPIYEDLNIGHSLVTVDPVTGRSFGPGCEESVLLPEFLPRSDK